MDRAELAIDVRGLTKRFGDQRSSTTSRLQVPRGEIFGFLGPNGSGKTTIDPHAVRPATPDAGSGTCLGYDIITRERRDQARRSAT